jgi:hypothetical protein
MPSADIIQFSTFASMEAKAIADELAVFLVNQLQSYHSQR